MLVRENDILHVTGLLGCIAQFLGILSAKMGSVRCRTDKNPDFLYKVHVFFGLAQSLHHK